MKFSTAVNIIGKLFIAFSPILFSSVTKASSAPELRNRKGSLVPEAGVLLACDSPYEICMRERSYALDRVRSLEDQISSFSHDCRDYGTPQIKQEDDGANGVAKNGDFSRADMSSIGFTNRKGHAASAAGTQIACDNGGGGYRPAPDSPRGRSTCSEILANLRSQLSEARSRLQSYRSGC